METITKLEGNVHLIKSETKLCSIHMDRDYNKISFLEGQCIVDDQDYIGANLYITSNATIKEGDWYITVRKDYTGQPAKCISINETSVISRLEGSNNPNHTQHTEFEFAKKIIATTDKSLKVYKHSTGVFKDLEYELPGIKSSLIKEYIKDYNLNKIITKVLIDYDILVVGDASIDKLLIDQDNTIFVSKKADEKMINESELYWSLIKVCELYEAENQIVSTKRIKTPSQIVDQWLLNAK